jgi:dihydrofolate synthase/folylpolyglutamate synthase
MSYLEKLNAVQTDGDFESFVISHCGKEQFTPGLTRLSRYVGDAISRIEKKGAKVITIAGTNGKGETAFSLEHILRKQGYKTALWTSPHITSIRERFVFDGKAIELDKLCERTKTILKNYQQFPELSYYELLFYIFCEEVDERLDDNFVIVLEVGLGGRFDAVNLFNADLCAITSISRDHEAILGRRYDLILREKFGVARRERTVVTNFFSDYLNQQMAMLSEGMGSHHLSLSKLGITAKEMNFSERNRLMAASLCSILMTGELNQALLEKNMSVLGDHSSKGREEVMTRGEGRFIFIGSHNCDGMRELVKRVKNSGLKNIRHFDGLLLSFSQRSEQDICAMLKMVADQVSWDKIWLISFDHPKAYGKLELKKIYDEFVKTDTKRAGLIEFIEDNSAFYHKLLQDKGPKNILVTGSYYFVSSVQQKINS